MPRWACASDDIAQVLRTPDSIFKGLPGTALAPHYLLQGGWPTGTDLHAGRTATLTENPA